MLRRGCFAGLLVGLSAWAASVFASPPPPVIPCPKLDGSPAIDGVREKLWDHATFLGGFVRTDGQALADDQTSVSLFTDGKNLYLFFDARTKDGKMFVSGKKRDDAVYLGEDVELFLCTNRKGDDLIHFSINPDGVVYDANRQKKTAWNFDWKVAERRDKSGWRVEMAIPPACLNQEAFPDRLYVNFCRTRARTNRRNERVFSCYAPTYGEFDRPARFAELRRSDFYVRENAEFAKGRAGAKDECRLGLLPRGGRSVAARAVVAAAGASRATERTIFVLHGESKILFSFNPPTSGQADLWREVLTLPDRAVIYRSQALRIVLPSVAPEIARIRALLAPAIGMLKRYKGSHPDAARSMQAKLQTMMKRLEKEQNRLLSSSPSDRVAVVKSVARELESERPAIFHAAAQARFLAKSDFADYAVGATHSLMKIHRDDFACLAESRPRVAISACRNEDESFQVMVSPWTRDLEDIAIRCSDLRCGDSILGAENVEFSLVGYVKSRRGNTVAWQPDPLLPAKKVSCAVGHFVTFWGTVHVPSSARAGDYEGSVEIAPANAPSISIPIRLHVFDFAIPTRSHFRTSFWIFRHTLRNFYGLKKVPFELYAKYLDMCLKHRLSPIDAAEREKLPFLKVVLTKDKKWRFDFTDVDRYLDFCMKRGMNAFNIGHDHWFYRFFYHFDALDEATGRLRHFEFQRDSKEENEILRAFLVQCRAHLKNKGWLPYAYLQAYDEPRGRRKAEVKAYYERVLKTWPDLKTLITAPPQKSMMGAVKIWVPLTPSYRLDVAEQRRKLGEEVWWYVCCGPREPYANFFLQQPATAHRMLFWQSWKYNSDGLLYWGVNHWPAYCGFGEPKKTPPEKRWPNVEWIDGHRRGDGYLMYPGPDGPFSSVRLEIIRDGMEDYEYFYLLRELLEKRGVKEGPEADLLKLDAPWIESLRKYTNSPELIQLRREQVARAIEKLERGD